MLKKLNVRLVVVSIILMVITYASSFIVDFNALNVIIGMVCGTLFSMIKMYMLNASINKVVEMDKQMAQKSATFSYGIRYMLTALVLIGTILYSLETFIGAAIILVVSTKIAVFSIKLADGDSAKFVDIDKEKSNDEKLENEKETEKEVKE